MWQIPSVEHIMLEHEEDVEYYGEKPQPELGGVPKEAAPVVIVVGDEEHLEHAEAPAREVQQDVAYTPANSTLPSSKDL